MGHTAQIKSGRMLSKICASCLSSKAPYGFPKQRMSIAEHYAGNSLCSQVLFADMLQKHPD